MGSAHVPQTLKGFISQDYLLIYQRKLFLIKYPPKYSVSWIAKRIKGRSSKLLRNRFPQLKAWCPGQFYADFPKRNQILQSEIGQYWAPSCYHGSVGQGWDVVEWYISGQKGYEKADHVPMVVIDEEKKKAHKIWYISHYNKLFEDNINKKSKSIYTTCDKKVV